MRKVQKLIGGRGWQMSKLKQLWRASLTEEQKEHWRATFGSDKTIREIFKELAAKLDVHFKYDHQLTRFRDWVQAEDARAAESERMERDLKELTDEKGKQLSKDQIREEVFRRSYARSLASADFKLGLHTVTTDQKERRLELDDQKFKESLRSKLNFGLDAVAETFRNNAEAMKLYEQALAVVAKETK